MDKETKKNLPESFVRWAMQGPNALLLTNELKEHMPIRPGDRILDLGCGKGLSSVCMAAEYDVTVFAVDPELPVDACIDAYRKLGFEKKIAPFHCDAQSMAFPEGFFDSMICINAYHLFGIAEPDFMRDYIFPYLKEGAFLGIVVPVLASEMEESLDDVTREMISAGVMPQLMMMNFWKNCFAGCADIIYSGEMQCTKQAWEDWIRASNPAAINDDTFAVETDAKNAFALIILQKKQ